MAFSKQLKNKINGFLQLLTILFSIMEWNLSYKIYTVILLQKLFTCFIKSSISLFMNLEFNYATIY